jgi:Kef-type K+ transport system membrane component KefB
VKTDPRLCFLLAMMIIVTVPYLLWRLGRTDRYAPLVVVQILTGIVLGPGVLGEYFPTYYATVFSPQVIQFLNGIAWWAVMVFVMIAGIELDLKSAWIHRKESALTASLALAVPLFLGSAVAWILYQQGQWIGASASPWQFILGIGMACAVTALPILVLFLEKLGILREALGQRVLRYASLDDLAIWAILALILLDWSRLAAQGVFIVGLSFAGLLIRWLMPKLSSEDRWYAALIWLCGCAFAADYAGLHFMVGSFLSGVMLDMAWFDRDRLDRLRHHVLLILMPVFFLSTGLRTDWSVGGFEVFGAALLLLLASVGGKLLGVSIAGWLLRWNKGESRLIGWLLQTKALIMIIFANILLDQDIIRPETFTALLLMAVVSTMLTMPQVIPVLRRIRI